MKIPHPIQYQGSKRNLANKILNFLPNQFDRLVEPFAGTGAISVACSTEKLTNKFFLNDFNKPLINLIELIVNNPKEISDFYEKLWNDQNGNSLEHYYLIRTKFNETRDPRLFLYLLSRCVKGAIRYNSNGEFNQSPDKRRRGANPKNMRENIFGVSNLLKGKVEFANLDYKELTSLINKNDVVYMDPPYQGVCGDRDSRYSTTIEKEEFIKFLNILNTNQIPYLISYDGACGDKNYGTDLPVSLGLKRIEINAGRSTQATLLGRQEITKESIYISHNLEYILNKNKPKKQLALL